VEERPERTTRPLQQLWSTMGQAGESISNKFTGKRGWLTT
jgi:hypothetical protein